ncbi:MAG: nucleotide exchange factor GrpE [Paludibacteraceae bacterium]|nr:nucleotide exchange factor GrpE [Paludibacteraceae bacterium]MBR4839608.1 nucleotide exchange factor GrpE [Paludibacteraceae bacterium]
MENDKDMEQEAQEKAQVEDPETNTVENEGEVENVSESEKEEEKDPVAELEAKCQKMHDDYMRLYADFDNYRKRAIKEKADLIKTAAEGVLVDILPLVDDFERAISSMENTESVEGVKEGVSLIYNKLISFLESKGVKAIDAVGQPFNTEFHEAITKFPAPSEEMKGKVIDCTQKGYTLYDKVIRYAKVVYGE